MSYDLNVKAFAVSILISSLLFVILITVSFTFYTNSIRSTTTTANKSGANLQETSNPTSIATNVKTQVDLKNIQTSLAIYFAEYCYYPIDLQELVNSGTLVEMDLSDFTYQRCDSDTVVVRATNGGFKLDSDRQTTELTC